MTRKLLVITLLVSGIALYFSGKGFAHEVVGLLFTACLLLHLLQWRRWWTSLKKGSYNLRRTLLVADNVIVAILTLATIVTGIYGSHSIFHWSGRSMQLMHMLGHYHQWLGYAMIPFMVGHILLNIQSFKMMVQAVKKRVVRPKVSITEE